MSNKKLDLKNDIIFKAFFSKKGNEEYLIDFLNALLKVNIKKNRNKRRSCFATVKYLRKRRKTRLASNIR